MTYELTAERYYWLCAKCETRIPDPDLEWDEGCVVGGYCAVCEENRPSFELVGVMEGVYFLNLDPDEEPYGPYSILIRMEKEDEG